MPVTIKPHIKPGDLVRCGHCSLVGNADGTVTGDGGSAAWCVHCGMNDLLTPVPGGSPDPIGTPMPPHPLTRDTIPLIFLMGATNVGKTTFMDLARGYSMDGAAAVKSDHPPVLGLVEVGKLMRAKYPPEHFKGQGAPAHTQTEAWQMLLDGIQKAADAGMQAVVIDGQPRNVEQVNWALSMSNPKLFLHLWAPPEVREERARRRDAFEPAKLELSLKRLVDDPRVLYDCLTTIEVGYHDIMHVNTVTHTPFDTLKRALHSCVGRHLL